MENAAKVAKIRDEERETLFGSIYSVSGPGKLNRKARLSSYPFQLLLHPLWFMMMHQFIAFPLYMDVVIYAI
jgi:hypothetical protein